jgi:hypothetical protein
MRYTLNTNHQSDSVLQNQFQMHQEALFSRYSKLLMLRIDFAYRRDSDAFLDADENELAAQMTYLLAQCADIPGLVGHVWVMEYTERHRFHVHAAFYIDGQRYRKAWPFWEQIQSRWDDITKGDGYSHRCEPKSFYRAKGEWVVAASDTQGRKGMQYILSYLAKLSQCTERPVYWLSFVPAPVLRGRPRQQNSHVGS